MPEAVVAIVDAGVISTLDNAYWFFEPRPDNVERGDEQTTFLNSLNPGVTFLLGGNGSGTTTAGLFKVAKFILEQQPPPHKDTPFWIIAESYQQVMDACWKEKLFGRGMIPESEIDRPRISWYKPNQNWPYRVPLKPWPGRPGKNWVLEFKSYAQGRAQMQASAIGGFLFVEQFPWGILEEVLRGCREYEFRGSKLAEFTPVDPERSINLEEMIDRDELPQGWQVCHANTECAVEAGQVSQEWFDEFFGMLPDEVKPVRCRGEFGKFAGQIYAGWNAKIHLVDDDVIDFPDGVQYRRTIDWGAGPQNAFVCLWMYRNGLGQWFVFDEYYSTDQMRDTVEHLVAVQERSAIWQWKEGHPLYGTTYADPSSPASIRIASKLTNYRPDVKPISITPANNSVLEGIEHVQYLLKCEPALDGHPRLFVHQDRCPKLAQQMRIYRWERGSESGLNPRDARRQPLKKDDHTCDALRYCVFTEASRVGGTIDRVANGHKTRAVQIQRHDLDAVFDRER